MKTVRQFLNYAVKKLSCSHSAKCDAEVLLSYVIKCSRIYLILHDQRILTVNESKLLKKLLNRRIKSEPIAYIIKRKEFWSLSFKIISGVFIPRPETERLVDIILDEIGNSSSRILDLGTGCGAIALSLAFSKLNCKVVGVDINQRSIDISHYNLKYLQLNNVRFIHSNWFSNIKNMTFNFIVSNPPYLNGKELMLLDKDIHYEPLNSLISFDNGLGDIKHIITYSKKYLINKGWLYIEHGWNQKKIVRLLFKQNSFCNILSFKDYGNMDRITCGQIVY